MTKYFQFEIITLERQSEILADIFAVTLMFHFKGHYNTIPKVIWQCPCHFLWLHLDFLSVCSSCHPMLIFPFPAQMFPLK